MKQILLTALMLSVITACTKTEEFCEADRQFHLRFGKSKNTPSCNIIKTEKVWINLEEKSTEAHTYSSY